MKRFVKMIVSLFVTCCCMLSSTACMNEVENSSNIENTLNSSIPEPVVCLHSYESEITKEPTCDETGVKTYTCSACGDTYEESIDMVDHTYTILEQYAPSESINGWIFYKCNVCSHSYREEIPKLPSLSFGSSVIIDTTSGSKKAGAAASFSSVNGYEKYEWNDSRTIIKLKISITSFGYSEFSTEFKVTIRIYDQNNFVYLGSKSFYSPVLAPWEDATMNVSLSFSQPLDPQGSYKFTIIGRAS